VVTRGTPSSEIINDLATAGHIRSAFAAQILLRTRLQNQPLQAGTYLLAPGTQSTQDIIQMLIDGDVYIETVSLTFREGETANAYATRAQAELREFSLTEWQALTKNLEGYLFPETYIVTADYTAEQLVTLLQNQFDLVYEELLQRYQNPPHTLTKSDIVTLASILEREANSAESKALVAGIFLNRLAIGMPLQADATIEYVLDTPLGELPPGQLATELRELDSPYNTYLYNELPPTPIGNPGRTALRAVLDPAESDYLYYLTGNDGEFYYAETYAEHMRNIERYLR
jgi:UPF0755 protein